MKIIKSHPLLLFITFICLFFSCVDSDETDSKYLYLPQQMLSVDSVTTFYTTYQYDNENRITGIINTGSTSYSTHYIKTSLLYDGSTLKEMNSDVSELVQRDTTFLYTTKRLFSYDGSKINISVTNTNGIDFPSFVIELDEKQRAIKRAENNTDKFIVYEYDNRGNITKTRNEVDSVYTYSYDTHRGIYREVNMEPWFINSVLDIPLDTIWSNIGGHRNLKNNCINIQREQKENQAVSFADVYEFTYGGFWYPISIENKAKFKLRVEYVPVN